MSARPVWDWTNRLIVKSGSHYLGGIGADIDHECNHRGGHRRDPNVERREAEEHPEHLDHQRCVADHFDIGLDGPDHPPAAIDARQRAQCPTYEAGDDRQHRHAQCQRKLHPISTHPGAQPAAENFYILHGP